MWKLVYGSARGTSHERLGQPCQDRVFGSRLVLGREVFLIASCADGAGSASNSDEGAELASRRIAQIISADLEEGLAVENIDRDRFLAWQRQLRTELSDMATIRGIDIRQVACTLLTAVIGENHAVFSQIGDGAIVVGERETYRTVLWPQNGEYANTTNFLTDPTSESRMEFASIKSKVDELAMFTDGLQTLALSYSDCSAHSPFFRPLFKSVRASDNADDLFAPLCDFLNSKPVNDRTDDDKTLLLATRRFENGA